ncbi:hypothetical protein [Spirosoma oryzicola]|uniref:hypothetical protein n=1 Tax=Spirosoma oryzicola TaxID=2898794 RepID=UPI001E5C33AF|nr:hypothetical protein [Spirosoma oryzicola]UHG93407.1 hypothetical protein LQ777_10990 [Spirosoma oryzicola]
MQRAKHPSTGCPSDPQQSLFKFHLHFHPHTQEYLSKPNGKPWVWYSFDKADERAMFPRGLDHELRGLYSNLLFDAYRWAELHNFLKECHPVWVNQPDQAPKLTFYMPRHMISTARDIGARYTETIDLLTDNLGIKSWNMDYLEQGRTVPGHSPLKKKIQYYGLDYFKRNPTIRKWFLEGKLHQVEVYDNRCYHIDNHYDTIPPEVFLAPTPATVQPQRKPFTSTPPAAPAPEQAWNGIPSSTAPPINDRPCQPSTNGRMNKAVSVGSILAHFPKQ